MHSSFQTPASGYETLHKICSNMDFCKDFCEGKEIETYSSQDDTYTKNFILTWCWDFPCCSFKTNFSKKRAPHFSFFNFRVFDKANIVYLLTASTNSNERTDSYVLIRLLSYINYILHH